MFDKVVSVLQVGVITFNDNSKVEFNLNAYSTDSALRSAIQQLNYMRGMLLSSM